MSERREVSRKRVYLDARIVHRCLRSETTCLLRNLSSGGARVVLSGTIPLPDRFDIVIDCRGTTQPVEMIWRAGDEIGVRFVVEASDRDDVTTLRHHLDSSRAELVRLRARVSDFERAARLPEDALH